MQFNFSARFQRKVDFTENRVIGFINDTCKIRLNVIKYFQKYVLEMFCVKEKEVSSVVVKRLPRYYRYLDELLKKGIKRISSTELSKRLGVTASQIRQDLNCFGGFGQQGYGYNVEMLHAKIANILGIDRHYKMIIVGAGHLGYALANYGNFQKRGFELVGLYDVSKDVIGTEIAGITVEDYNGIANSLKNNKADIAILTVPKAAVTNVATILAGNGIKAILNFTSAELDLPDNIKVENVHISDTLMTLSYGLTNQIFKD